MGATESASPKCPPVLDIESKTNSELGTLSGKCFVIAPGVVATALHVIFDFKTAFVTDHSTKRYAVTGILHGDIARDLAILKVDGLGSDSTARFALELPLRFTQSHLIVSRGFGNDRPSMVDLEFAGTDFVPVYGSVLFFRGTVENGLSGAPVVDDDGGIIAMQVASTAAGALCIPFDLDHDWLDRLPQAFDDWIQGQPPAFAASSELWLNAQLLLKNAEYEAGLDTLSRAIALDPSNWWAQANQMEAFISNGQHELALSIRGRLLAEWRRPQYLPTFLANGLRPKRFQVFRSILHTLGASNAEPDGDDACKALFTKSQGFVENNDVVSAVELLSESRTLCDDARSLALLAAMYVVQAADSKAISLARQASQHYPNDPALSEVLARVYIASGEYQLAEEEIKRPIEQDDQRSAIRGLLALQRGEYETAERELKDACSSIDSPDAWIWLAQVRLHNAQVEQAISALSHAQSLGADSYPLWYTLGRAYLKAGRFELAEAPLMRAIESDPHSTEAVLNAAQVLHQIDCTDRAIECIAASDLILRGDESAWCWLAFMLDETGRLNELWQLIQEYLDRGDWSGVQSMLIMAICEQRGWTWCVNDSLYVGSLAMPRDSGVAAEYFRQIRTDGRETDRYVQQLSTYDHLLSAQFRQEMRDQSMK